MYVFIQVYPVEHRFDKVIGYTTDKTLVDKVLALVESNEAFKHSFHRLDSEIIYNITENEMKIVEEVNKLIGASLDWVDELIIQEIQPIEEPSLGF